MRRCARFRAEGDLFGRYFAKCGAARGRGRAVRHVTVRGGQAPGGRGRRAASHPPNLANLVDEAEHPDGDAGAAADFGVGHGEVAVRKVLDLPESFLAPANLEEPFAVDEHVAGGRIGERPSDSDLVHEEAFAERPGIGLGDERADLERLRALLDYAGYGGRGGFGFWPGRGAYAATEAELRAGDMNENGKLEEGDYQLLYKFLREKGAIR